MRRLKDFLYNYLVRKNGRVWYEYERYVREHIEEHYIHRFRHIYILLKLNWFYRVKKGKTPFLFWDTPLEPKDWNHTNKSERQTIKTNNVSNPVSGNPWIYPEIKVEPRLPINELVEYLANYDVISFDVFDTLIFRYVSDPKIVFHIVGNKLGIYDFANTRVKAETEARKISENPYGEVDLEKIYDLVALYLGVDKNKALLQELEIEKKVCFPNPYMKEVLDALVNRGKRVIATSNMYMSSKQIKDILDNCGYSYIEEIYSSCEIGCPKNKGILQKYIWQLIGQDKSVIHVGDNYLADYVGSRMIGWKAYYYRNVNDIGRNYRPAKMSKVVGSIYGGIVNSNFHNGVKDNETIYYELGFGYLGLLLVGYCQWINEFAKKNKLNKLLFSSRDMCLVFQVYQKYYSEVDSAYIKISRFASQRFAYQRFSDYYIDSHIKARALIAKLTISDVVSELCIDFMMNHLQDYGLQSDAVFTMDNFEVFRQCLNDNKNIMLEHFENEKKASIDYYKQFVDRGDRVGIVDLGWQGTNALCLKYLMEEEMNMDLSVKSLLMVSWGTRDFVLDSFSAGVADVYCFSALKNEQFCHQFSPTKMGRFICELLFSSNEQSLKAISKTDDGKIDFSYISNEKRNSQDLDDMYRGAVEFVEVWEKLRGIDLSIAGFEAILPLNKLSYSDVCFEIMEGNEINPWIGETKASAASDVRKIVR